jgi:NADP-dependent 3-hydroxy acid dehydrogenase YdfG
MEDLADRTFVVAGSGSGMGLATATTLANRGARLALCDINHDSLEKLGSELNTQHPGKIIVQAIDVTDRRDRSRCCESFFSRGQ